MLRPYFHIAALLAKSLTRSLTPEETRELAEWTNASPHNRRLAESVSRKENLGRYIERASKYDKTAGWEQVQKRIRQARRKRIRTRVMRYAALLLLPVAAAITLYYLQRPEKSPAPTAPPATAATVVPGSSKAILTLGTGETVCLDSASVRELTENGAQIDIRNSSLTYAPASPETTEPETTVYNRIEVPRGGEYRLCLSDGSLVHLNAMSSLRYPVRFTGTTREVELCGEAFFEVKKDDAPFVVKTDDAEIRVLGTTFNICAYPENHNIQTTLVTGSVQMQAPGGESVVLEPSQQAELDNRSHRMAVRRVDVSLYTSWTQGKIYFKDERLDRMMAVLSRWYDVDVTFKDARLKELRFGCNLNRYDEIGPFLKLLDATGRVHTGIKARTIVIY